MLAVNLIRGTAITALVLGSVFGLGCSESMSAHPDAYVGVGCELTMDAAGARVVRVIAGSPAHEAGLTRDDVILEVEGKPARGETLATVVSWLRGKAGTDVKVMVRAKEGERSVTLHRQHISNK